MSQEGTDLSQETHDHTFIMVSKTPLGLTKKDHSKSNKFDENNTSSNPTISVVSGDDIKGRRQDLFITNKKGEGDGGGGITIGVSEPKCKSSSDEGDCELMGVVTGTSEGCIGGNGNNEVKSSADVNHMMHAWTERGRRKEMNNKFDLLHALVPNLSEKVSLLATVGTWNLHLDLYLDPSCGVSVIERFLLTQTKADKATIVEATINYIKNLQNEVYKLETLKMQQRKRMSKTRTLRRTPRRRPRPPAAANADGEGSATPVPAPPVPEEEEAVAPTRETALADMVHVWEEEEVAGGGARHGWRGSPAPLQTWTGSNMTVSLAGDDAFITLSLPRGLSVVTGAVWILERHHIDVRTATLSTPDQDSSLLSLHCHLSPACSSSQNLTPVDKYKLAVSELMLWIAS
uniref:BHLH domain-containing protein n=1 Tax=Oryza brachyantha TaxID=4533 RepID=J3LXW8_ORYBR